ncbi:TolB family protein [Heyndrickxia sp. NPDC080065]|uniref:TolB family protein n=1 Tax=Heyndrickxia sp. NPDC080065 TaxID=3390568 RepID=UPI003D064737
MGRILLLTIVLSILFPVSILATGEKDVKAGFIRDGNLWVLINNKEKQITNTGKVYDSPKWSHDGKWLLYQNEAPSKFQENEKQVEVWVYNIETKEKKKIFYDGYSPTWAPNKNIVAFNSRGILDISNFKRFYNIATGVDSYTWLPDGSGFLLSSAGVLRPDGWSSAILFTKKVNENYKDIVLFGGVKPFYTLPREIGVNNNKIIAVYAGNFEFSPSHKWISFIVSPTASWSMDSNMLCVISKDGKDFHVLDEVIFGVGKPKWAPSSDTIAFIAGGGRIVFGFKNKDLKIREMPVSGTYTPPNYADLDFDWVTDKTIVTSRVKETEWSNDFSKHPLPELYSINIETKKQVNITKPPKGYGDYSPLFVESIGKLVWLRGTSITDLKRTLWKAKPDGTDAREWIKNVDAIEFYEGR